MDVYKFWIFRFIETNKIKLLLISILMMTFGPPYMGPNENVVELYVKGVFLLIAIACFFIIRKITISRYIAIITYIMIIIDYLLDYDILDYLAQIGLTWLILHAFSLVLKEAMSLKEGAKNMILVSITGYLIIGLIGGFIAAALDSFYPNSYYHSTGIELDLYNYIYYSFVTMTTLGYGDIIPVTEKSQSLALMLVLAGQLFLSIIIAMNIAKFMKKGK